MTLKLLVVNPSETEVKEFAIRSPLPPEIKPEHVLEADGLKVEYDSQAGTYMLVGTVTLKPKESVTRSVVLDDVWVVPVERVSSLQEETEEIMDKLSHGPYEAQGRLLADAINRRIRDIHTSQEQPFVNPQQHISRYREHLKALQLLESDLVSLRQLMVMSALKPSTDRLGLGGAGGASGSHERGRLSVATTWRFIFFILGLLGFVSLSFFLVWQRQLKLQLAKQAARDRLQPQVPLTSGNGKSHPAPPVVSQTQPRSPFGT